MNYAELSEALMRGAVSAAVLKTVGDKLVTLAEYAYRARRTDDLEEVSRILINCSLPIRCEYIGLLYKALSLQMPGSLSHLEPAAALLQHSADHSTPYYRV